MTGRQAPILVWQQTDNFSEGIVVTETEGKAQRTGPYEGFQAWH